MPLTSPQALTGLHATQGDKPLIVYMGPDEGVVRALRDATKRLPTFEIEPVSALKHGESAAAIILDCRSPDPGAASVLQMRVPCMALIDANRLDRAVLFNRGFTDFLLWPLFEREVIRRFDSCLCHIHRQDAVPLFAIDPIVQSACIFMSERITRKPSLREIARHTGTNRTTLVDKFQTCFACGPITWLRHHRLAEAAKWLRTDTRSVTQIAHLVGYESSNNFSTAFKGVHGVSPLRYRKMALRREKPV